MNRVQLRWRGITHAVSITAVPNQVNSVTAVYTSRPPADLGATHWPLVHLSSALNPALKSGTTGAERQVSSVRPRRTGMNSRSLTRAAAARGPAVTRSRSGRVCGA